MNNMLGRFTVILIVALTLFGAVENAQAKDAPPTCPGKPSVGPQTEALPEVLADATVAAFEKYEVLSERELESRYEVSLEQYVTTVNIEGETAASIARTMLLPAAVQWYATLGAAGDSSGVGKLTAEIAGLVDEFVDAIFALETANRDHPEDGEILAEAKYVQSTVLPAMQAVRDVADKLERIVPDDLWPLPKYSEILFIK